MVHRTSRPSALVRLLAVTGVLISSLGAGSAVLAQSSVDLSFHAAPRPASAGSGIRPNVAPSPIPTACAKPTPTPSFGATATATPCTPDIQMFVSSHNTSSVLRYDAQTGAFSDSFVPTAKGGLNGAHAMSFDVAGDLYVTDDSGHSVLRYDADGLPLHAAGQTGATFVAAGSGGLSHPSGLAFGSDGDLYITSQGTNSVLRFNGATGAPRPASGQTGATFVPTGSGGLSSPSAVVFGQDGNLYVTSAGSNTILKYAGPTGAFVSAFV